MTEDRHAEVTEHIIRAFYTVYNTLGYGFLEKVYVKALLLELKNLGLGLWPTKSLSTFSMLVR
jgi:GxxExxY protein